MYDGKVTKKYTNNIKKTDKIIGQFKIVSMEKNRKWKIIMQNAQKMTQNSAESY